MGMEGPAACLDVSRRHGSRRMTADKGKRFSFDIAARCDWSYVVPAIETFMHKWRTNLLTSALHTLQSTPYRTPCLISHILIGVVPVVLIISRHRAAMARHYDPDKNHKKPFSVGPANLPDGQYRRKGASFHGRQKSALLRTVQSRKSRAT